jgi:hypothetical protein
VAYPNTTPVASVGAFEVIACYPVYPQSVFVHWRMLYDKIDPGAYRFNIYRSGGPQGPWDKVTVQPVDRIDYNDADQNLLSKYREVYYYIEAISSRGTKYYSPVKNLVRVVERSEYTTAMEINRQEMLLLKNYAGIEVHIFKKRHFGDNCECFDTSTNTIITKNCPICGGTRYKGGYFAPIKTYANISPDRKSNQEGGEAKVEISRASGWMTAYPIVSPDDIFVELDTNRRWVIKLVENTELRRFPVKQTLTLNELSHSEIEYTKALDMCLNKFINLNEIPDHGRPI